MRSRPSVQPRTGGRTQAAAVTPRVDAAAQPGAFRAPARRPDGDRSRPCPRRPGPPAHGPDPGDSPRPTGAPRGQGWRVGGREGGARSDPAARRAATSRRPAGRGPPAVGPLRSLHRPAGPGCVPTLRRPARRDRPDRCVVRLRRLRSSVPRRVQAHRHGPRRPGEAAEAVRGVEPHATGAWVDGSLDMGPDPPARRARRLARRARGSVRGPVGPRRARSPPRSEASSPDPTGGRATPCPWRGSSPTPAVADSSRRSSRPSCAPLEAHPSRSIPRCAPSWSRNAGASTRGTTRPATSRRRGPLSDRSSTASTPTSAKASNGSSRPDRSCSPTTWGSARRRKRSRPVTCCSRRSGPCVAS